jgi:glycosyltransferase involved in cell wall biosynthesis
MIDTTKTLLILSPGFPKDESDTTCVPAQQIFVKNLKQNFPELNIIVLAFEYPFFSGEYDWHNVKVMAFGGRNRSRLFRLQNWVRIWLSLQKLKKQYNIIGLLSFWMGECALIGNTFAKRNNLKFYCWILGQDARLWNKYFKWIKPKAGSLIALSDFIAKEFNKNYSITPANVIPIGVDPALFKPATGERDIDILGAGSLIPLKQYFLLINIVNFLRDSFPDIKAVICGDGPEMESLRIMVRTLKLENNVTLMGELPHTSVLALMQRAKIFVHTSAYEGFGVVCLEALYAGAHVVSFVRPMDANIKNWHFAYLQDDMLKIITRLLKESAQNHTPVSPYLVNDSNKSVMNLFDYKEEAVSA